MTVEHQRTMAQVGADGAADLVARINAGDGRAETELVASYRDSIVKTLKHRGPPQDAEDLAHDALLTIIERLRGKSIAEPDRLAGFMHGVATRKLTAEWRKQVRRRTHSDSSFVEEQASSDVAQVDHLIRRQNGLAVSRLIDELTVARDRAILRRYYLLEQEKDQICRDLNLTARQFDRIIHRARCRLKALVLATEPELAGSRS